MTYFESLVFFCSYALFDADGRQVPQELVQKVGEVFESILEEASLHTTLYLLITTVLILPVIYKTVSFFRLINSGMKQVKTCL